MSHRPRRAGQRRRARLSALLALLVLAACGGAERPRVDLLLTAPRLFDGERLIRDGAVAVRGSSIVAAGRRDDVEVDAERTIALEDATLLPGFVDLHVHALGQGQASSVVTTVRDLGAPDVALPLAPPQPGEPRVLAAGPIVTAPGGYPIPIHGPEIAHVVRGPDEARAYVRSLAERGAAAIKISLQTGFPILSEDELRAIVDEAHRHDLRVTAHVGEPAGARLALDGGVDELAHMPCGPDPELMRELAAAGVEIVGTLHVARDLLCRDVVENARAFVGAGGRLLYGSDFGNAGVPPGLDVVELQLMADAGLSAREVLTNATAAAGATAGVDAGRLAPEAPADVVAFRGDPTRDLDDLRGAPLLVVVRGRIVLGG